MFKSHRNTISTDEGFVVKVLSGRGGLSYTEGDRQIGIDSEFSGGMKGVILYSDSIVWWVGPEGRQVVSAVERGRIVDNIRRAFQFDGYSLEVV
jgi:hypothetical protein